MKPFRWNINKTEQLGSLVSGEVADSYPEFLDDLRVASARLISFSEDGYLAFVGRSPESFYDYLSGVFDGTSRQNSCVLLNISNRFESLSEISVSKPESAQALKDHFDACQLSPSAILHREQVTRFVDLVARGGTFEQVAMFILTWADAERIPRKEILKKLSFIGITWRTKTSPNTWRWQQACPWVKELGISNIKNVSIPGRLWDYLGNTQDKVSPSNYPKRWTDDSMLEPPREEWNLKAMRLALNLYQTGIEEQKKFTEILVKEPAMKEAWLRKIVSELRGS